MKFLTTFYIILFVFVIIQQTTNGIKVERATSSLRRNQQKNSRTNNQILAPGGSGSLAALAQLVGPPSIEVPAGYDRLSRPNKNNKKKADQISVGIKLKRIEDINEKDSVVVIDAIVVTKWTDNRLVDVVKNTKRILAKDVWVPDLAFANQAKEPNFFQSEMTLNKNGNIVHERRVVATMELDIELDAFPFDHHEIPIIVNAYGYDSNEVLLKPNFNLTTNAINDPNWYIEAFIVQSDVRKTEMSDKQSVVECNLVVKRKIQMIMTTIIAPLVLIVLFSFLAFFVRERDFGSRITITSIALLTVMTFMFVLNAEMPKISYLTWMHYYMALSFVFTFMVSVHVTMVEFLTSEVTRRRHHHVHAYKGDEAQLRNVWKIADANGDGVLNLEEFRKLMESSGVELDDSKIKDMFNTIDTDNSGDIDYLEFKAYIVKSRMQEFDDDDHEINNEHPLLQENLKEFKKFVEKKDLIDIPVEKDLMKGNTMGMAFKMICGYSKDNIEEIDRSCRCWLPCMFFFISIIMILIEMHNIMYIYKENPEWVNMHNGPRNTMINTKEDPLKFF